MKKKNNGVINLISVLKTIYGFNKKKVPSKREQQRKDKQDREDFCAYIDDKKKAVVSSGDEDYWLTLIFLRYFINL